MRDKDIQGIELNMPLVGKYNEPGYTITARDIARKYLANWTGNLKGETKALVKKLDHLSSIKIKRIIPIALENVQNYWNTSDAFFDAVSENMPEYPDNENDIGKWHEIMSDYLEALSVETGIELR